jgi:hypothetical protein
VSGEVHNIDATGLLEEMEELDTSNEATATFNKKVCKIIVSFATIVLQQGHDDGLYNHSSMSVTKV